MTSIQRQHVDQLIAVEAHVHYGVPPPSGRAPFVAARRSSPVLFSAPHGAITYRNSHREMWHDEDDYTAGIALLLAELCGTAAIATIWRTDGEDPNYHLEASSAYKRALGRLVAECGVRWVIDLHGARDSSIPRAQLVDLGTRRDRQSLSSDLLAGLVGRIEDRLGPGTVSHNVFPARVRNRTITAFCQDTLGISSVQVEMKSAVRAPQRRVDATAYAKEGPYSAPPERVIGMLQALADFVADLYQAAR